MSDKTVLTDERIAELWAESRAALPRYATFARAIERAVLAASEDRRDAPQGFYLASFKRPDGLVTWWRPGNAGYTPYLDQAGIYQQDELIADYHDSEYTVPVPCAFVDQFVDRVVDTGMSKCGETFWSAKNLRAAIAAAGNHKVEG